MDDDGDAEDIEPVADQGFGRGAVSVRPSRDAPAEPAPSDPPRAAGLAAEPADWSQRLRQELPLRGAGAREPVRDEVPAPGPTSAPEGAVALAAEEADAPERAEALDRAAA
ncbi:MAG: hypothetical protein ACTH0C_08245, partial [Actinomycetaceae bacterium]